MSLLPDFTFFYQLAVFLLLFVVLNFLLFKPLLRMFERREQGVRGPEERAGSLRDQMEEMKAGYDKRIGDALAEAERIRTELVREANAGEREILGSARAEMESTFDQARRQIAQDKDRALECLRSVADRFAAEISESILGRRLKV